MIFNLLYFFFLYQSYNLYNPLGQIFTTEINEIWDQLNNLNKSFDIIEDNNLSEIVISISGPIYINNSRNGFLIIFLSFDKVLQISQDYSGLGNTGETVLAKRDENGYALFISPLRFDNYAALNKTISKLDINVPIIQALQKQEIFFPSSLDYRSENVLATTRYIESIDLGLVVKIDYNQAFQNLNTFTNLIVFFITLIILVLILISYLVSRSITVPILNLIKLTEEISKGDYSRKISIKSNNELKILGNSFNKMTSSLVLSNQGLIDSKNQIEAIINNMTTGILVLNHIGGVIYINKTYKDMYSALTESEIPPVNNLADKIINNDFTDIIIKFLNQESFIEDTVEMQDDLHLRINKTSIIDKNNDITGYIFQLTDVSSFIEYEKLQKKFISTVSHELRTPITGIILTINNLKKYLPKLTEDQTKSMINTIIDRSSVLLDLIEDLLFLLRTESQSIKL